MVKVVGYVDMSEGFKIVRVGRKRVYSKFIEHKLTDITKWKFENVDFTGLMNEFLQIEMKTQAPKVVDENSPILEKAAEPTDEVINIIAHEVSNHEFPIIKKEKLDWGRKRENSF